MTKSYEWKEKIAFDVEQAIQAAWGCLPNGYSVAGISIINDQEVEAEYFTEIEPDGQIWTMDVLSDLKCDLNSLYSECFDALDKDVSVTKLDQRLSDIESAILSAKQQMAAILQNSKRK